MNQSQLITTINESIEESNILMRKWTNNRYFLGSPHIRSEGFIGSVMMQKIMQEYPDLHILPEKSVKELLEDVEKGSELEKIRKGRLDIALFNKNWNLLYPIEIKRERLKLDVNKKMKPGCMNDIVRLATLRNLLPKMKAGILAVFIFEKSKNTEDLEKK